GFIYIGHHGFLRAQDDQREFEFRFLKGKGVRLFCIFTGTDIRSIVRMKALEEEMGIPNVATYFPEIEANTGTREYDNVKRRLATTADTYADCIMTAAIDQSSYLTESAEPFRYFFPDEQITDSLDKFDNPQVLTILHAPS